MDICLLKSWLGATVLTYGIRAKLQVQNLTDPQSVKKKYRWGEELLCKVLAYIR